MGKLRRTYSGNAARITGLRRSELGRMLDEAERELQEMGFDVDRLIGGEKTRTFLRLYLLLPGEVREKMLEYAKGRYSLPHMLSGPRDLSELVDLLRELGDERIGGGRDWRWWKRLSESRSLEELISTLESLGDMEVLGMKGKEWAEKFRSGEYDLEKALKELRERAGRPAKEWADYFIRRGLSERYFNLERALRELEMGGEEEAIENLMKLGVGRAIARRVVKEPIKSGQDLPRELLFYLYSLPLELRRYVFLEMAYVLGKRMRNIDSQTVYKANPVVLAILYFGGYFKGRDVEDPLYLLGKVREGLEKLREVYPEVFFGVEVEQGIRLSSDEVSSIQDALRRRGVSLEAGEIRKLLSEALGSPLEKDIWKEISRRRWSGVANLMVRYLREKDLLELLSGLPGEARKKLIKLPQELREEVLEYLKRRDPEARMRPARLEPRLAFLLTYLGLIERPEIYSDHIRRGWEELREKYPDLFGERPSYILDLPPAWEIKSILKRAGSKDPERDFFKLLNRYGEEFLDLLRTRPRGYLDRLRSMVEEWHRVPVSGKDEVAEVKVNVIGEGDTLAMVIQEIAGVDRGTAGDIARDLVGGSMTLDPYDKSEGPRRAVLYRLLDAGILTFVSGRKEEWFLRKKWRENARKALEKELEELEREILRRRSIPYVCSHCGKGYTDEAALEHRFTCPECGAAIFPMTEATPGRGKYERVIKTLEKRRERIRDLISLI